MNKLKIVLWSVLAIIILLILIIAFNFLDLGVYSFFAPKKENVRREVFENTRSYNQGKIQELAKLKLEFELADNDDKEIIKNTIRHKFADYNNDNMPRNLQIFLQEIRGY
jgi:predicted membrane-bound dolichyl-phosphate-mannose-protein mannosyltransferase